MTAPLKGLQFDPVMFAANRDARSREGNATATNPIFSGGAMKYDGVLYKNIISKRLPNACCCRALVLAASISSRSLCAARARLAYAMGQMPRPTTLEDGDYEFITGLGIECQYGMAKIAKAPQSIANATAGVIWLIGVW